MESAHWQKTGTLLKLSEQNIVDCDEAGAGCGGGYATDVFNYAAYDAQMLLADYPYTGTDDKCAYEASKGAVKADGWRSSKSGSVEQLKASIASAVTSVRVHVGNSFKAYSSGIYDDVDCGDAINHAINAVGYGSSEGVEYFILRNSWGAAWGEEGYMRMAMGQDGPGICAILHGPSAVPSTD